MDLSSLNLCQALGQCRQTKKQASSEKASKRKTAEREKRSWEPVSIFTNTSVCPLPEKLFLLSEWHVKMSKLMCCKGGCPHPHYVFSLALDVWSQAIDVVDVNCWNWPIKGYTRSWHIRMRYWKHWWQDPLSHLSPASTWFSCIFFRCTFPTILEPGTGLNSLRPNFKFYNVTCYVLLINLQPTS